MFAEFYDNIGGKIKGLAVGIFVFEAISSMISGLSMLVIDDGDFHPLFWSGLALLIFGPIAAFVSSWILYGFGELVENSTTNKDTITEMDVRLMKIESHCMCDNTTTPKVNPIAPTENSNTSSTANTTEQTDKPTEIKAHEKAEQAEVVSEEAQPTVVPDNYDELVAAKKEGSIPESAFMDKLNSMYWNGRITSKQYDDAQK